MKNKRGWIRIVEAFVALLLIIGVLLIVINKGYLGKSDISEKVYEAEKSVLREIELNDSLRKEILGVDLPAEGGVKLDDDKMPQDVKKKIINWVPSYLECTAKLCRMDELCKMDSYLDKEVYAKSVGITATLQNYSPRKLTLFCWEK
ncbi:MAG: hypothetical protein KKA64_00225 [Nanoarchaeota archaeon]|nr:hypothetical protein [Nanoarchaeota archaeon]